MLLITLAPRPPSSLPPQTARTRWRRPRSRPYNNFIYRYRRKGKLWGKNVIWMGNAKKPSKYLTFPLCPSGTTRKRGPRGSSPGQGRRPRPGCVWKSKNYFLFFYFYLRGKQFWHHLAYAPRRECASSLTLALRNWTCLFGFKNSYSKKMNILREMHDSFWVLFFIYLFPPPSWLSEEKVSWIVRELKDLCESSRRKDSWYLIFFIICNFLKVFILLFWFLLREPVGGVPPLPGPLPKVAGHPREKRVL